MDAEADRERVTIRSGVKPFVINLYYAMFFRAKREKIIMHNERSSVMSADHIQNHLINGMCGFQTV